MNDKDYPVLYGELAKDCHHRPSWRSHLQDLSEFEAAQTALDGRDVAVIPLDVYQRLVHDRMEQRQAWDNLRAEIQQWREACAKKDHWLAAKDDRIADLERDLCKSDDLAETLHSANDGLVRRVKELERKLDTAHTTHAVALAEKDRRISVLRGLADYLERDLLAALEDVDTLERKMSDYKDLQAECDCLQSMLTQAQRELAQRCSESVTVQEWSPRVLGDLDNAMARMVGELANAQEMVRALIVEATPAEEASEEADAWQPYTHGHPLAEGDYWLRFSDDTVSVIPLQWRFVDEYGDVHGVWVMAVDPAGIDTKDMEDPETIVAVLPVRRPTTEAPTAEPAPDLRPVPAWSSLTREELDSHLSMEEMSGEYWMAPLIAIDHLDAWAIWEQQDPDGAVISLVLPGGCTFHHLYRPQRLPGQREDGTIPASEMTQAHRERVRDWQWRANDCCEWSAELAALDWPTCGEYRPAIWAELDAIPDEATKLAEEFDRQPPPDERAEPPTFAARIRHHAQRAGYRAYDVEGILVVRNDSQALLRSGSPEHTLGRIGHSWVKMSEESALRFAQSWPSKQP